MVVVVWFVTDVTAVGADVVVLQLGVFHIADPRAGAARQDMVANKIRPITSTQTTARGCDSRDMTEAQPD